MCRDGAKRDHRCVKAKFEIPGKAKKTPRRTKAPSVEIERGSSEDDYETMHKDLEQEVKDAEKEKAQTKRIAAAKAATAAPTVAADGGRHHKEVRGSNRRCSEDSNGSTDGSSRWRSHHKEQCGSSRSNRSIGSTRNKGKRQRSWPSYKKGR